MGVGGQHHAQTALPLGKTWCPLYVRQGEHQGQSGWVRKISPRPGFNPWPLQPIASHHSDYTLVARGVSTVGTES